MNSLIKCLKDGKFWIAGVTAAAAILSACGGGGGGGEDSAANNTGSAAASGPITGFGSIIVNGVRYDDSTALITLNDDDSGSGNDLKLGMVVNIEGTRDNSLASGRASSISASSYVQGPISDAPAGNQFTVLGITVTVNARTLYDGVAGFGGLAQNDTVEVHGMPNAAGGITATRIESKATAEVRLTGRAQNITASDFQVNGISVQFQAGDLHNLPGGVTDGMLVRVRGTALNATTVDATRVRQVRLNPSFRENQEVEIKGVVTRFASAGDFDVNGQPVSLAQDAEIEAGVALNSFVEVEGRTANGVLVAREVKLEDTSLEQEYELHASIASLNAGAKTFTARNGTITVQWNGSTQFDGLLESSLANGLPVEIKGEMSNGVLTAMRIKRED